MTLIEKFKALSCETRYNIYNMLRRRQMSIEEISNLINLKPITVRHHISELERSGLICKKLNRVSLIGRPSTVYGINSDLLETSLMTRNYPALQEILFTSIQNYFKNENQLLLFYNFLGRELAHMVLAGLSNKDFNSWSLKDVKEKVFFEKLQNYAPMPELVEDCEKFFIFRLYTCPFLEHALPSFESLCKILSESYMPEMANIIGIVDISVTHRRTRDKPFCEFKVSLKESKNL